MKRAFRWCRRVLGVLLDLRFSVFLVRRVFHALVTARAEYLTRRRALGALRMGVGTTIAPDAVIGFGPPEGGKRSITLGRDVSIGRRVQLTVAGESAIEIGDATTINDNTVILGDVVIGRHCLLSCNIFIS
jgi:carbonic anhydrase/acetyltransferase-like protein (isoleucine patch superfamily)